MLEIFILLVLFGLLIGGISYKDVIKLYWVMLAPYLIILGFIMVMVLMVIVIV